MRIFKNGWFARFSEKKKITDEALIEAVKRAEQGQIDADLGSGIIKQRIARKGQGKSGGYRTLIVYRVEDRAFFMFGFAKNKSDNVSEAEFKILKRYAKDVMNMNEDELNKAVEEGEIVEVKYYE